MIYTIIGDFNSAQVEINKIKPKEENSSVQVYDSTLTTNPINLAEIIDSCQTIPMFDSYQVIILQSARAIFKQASPKELDRFFDYLQNPKDFTDLIIHLNKADKRQKIYKQLKKHTKVKEIKPKKQPTAYDLVNVVNKRRLKTSLEMMNSMLINGVQDKKKAIVKNKASVTLMILGALTYNLRQNFKRLPKKTALVRHAALREADLEIKSGSSPEIVLSTLLVKFCI